MKRAKFGLALALMVVALGASAVGASAQGDPYAQGTAGYDVSYPQCPGTTAPAGSFAIIGVNGGRPFTFNSCFGNEYGAAPKVPVMPSLYLNTGYATTYRKSITSGCTAAPASITGSAQRQAWEIGCSEADTSVRHAGRAGAAMWWVDVETANSWSTNNLGLNRYTIQGAADRLHALTTTPVGVYSTAAAWSRITGGGNFSAIVDGEWDAGATACPAHGTIGFTGAQVWLEQTGSAGGVDSDSAC